MYSNGSEFTIIRIISDEHVRGVVSGDGGWGRLCIDLALVFMSNVEEYNYIGPFLASMNQMNENIMIISNGHKIRCSTLY